MDASGNWNGNYISVNSLKSAILCAFTKRSSQLVLINQSWNWWFSAVRFQSFKYFGTFTKTIRVSAHVYQKELRVSSKTLILTAVFVTFKPIIVKKIDTLIYSNDSILLLMLARCQKIYLNTLSMYGNM